MSVSERCLRPAPAGLRAVGVMGIALVCAGALCAPAWGQQNNSREQEQLRRLRLQVQQLQQEQSVQQDAAQRAVADKAALQTQLAQAQTDLVRARAVTSAQAKGASDAQRELDALRAAHTAMTARAEAAAADLQARNADITALRTEGTGLQRNLATRDAALADLQTRHGVQAQGLQTCIANNQALHATGQELLQRYANKGVADVLADNEPFLQFQRVALENLVQGYQDKLDRQALRPAAAGTAPGAGPARAP